MLGWGGGKGEVEVSGGGRIPAGVCNEGVVLALYTCLLTRGLWGEVWFRLVHKVVIYWLFGSRTKVNFLVVNEKEEVIRED